MSSPFLAHLKKHHSNADVCAYKTARRNVYPTEAVASKRAEHMTKKCQTLIRHFQCKVCKLWHIGRANQQ